jgi:DNA-binding NarL/FixJ family response regulator
MPTNNLILIDETVAQQIPELRAQGLTIRKIAEVLGVSDGTVRKYQNYTFKYKFTARQIEIARAALEKSSK